MVLTILRNKLNILIVHHVLFHFSLSEEQKIVENDQMKDLMYYIHQEVQVVTLGKKEPSSQLLSKTL